MLTNVNTPFAKRIEEFQDDNKLSRTQGKLSGSRLISRYPRCWRNKEVERSPKICEGLDNIKPNLKSARCKVTILFTRGALHLHFWHGFTYCAKDKLD